MAFSNLVQSLNTTCCITLQRKINKFIQAHVPCHSCLIVYISDIANEGLIQVIGDTVLDEEFRFRIQSQFDLRCASIGERQSLGLNQDVESKLRTVLNPYPSKLLKVPVKHPDRDGHISFLVYLLQPEYRLENDDYNYSIFVKECLGTCSAILLNAFYVKEEWRMIDLYQKLSFTAKNCLFRLGDYNELLTEIMVEARLLMNAERCSLFLLSEDKTELVAKIFDGVPTEQLREIKIPIKCGIVGYVATNGEILNIDNASNHPLFYKSMDESTGFKTRNILCFPVRNETGQIVGVAEVINKRELNDFTQKDEEAASIFSIYMGIALMHSIVHKRFKIYKACHRLSMELVTYHLTQNSEDMATALDCKEKHKYEEMLDHGWLSRRISSRDTVCYVKRMFENLNFTGKWKIQPSTLVSFILTVRRGYRDMPYHNWSHAFSVAHAAYLFMIKFKLIRTSAITELEGISFLVSALCHDLDHRGTTNTFQVVLDNSLAVLYSCEGSVMERHHFSQTLAILNTKSCNIFENLSVDEYVQALHLIRDMIVATDITQHFKVLPDEQKMSIHGYNPWKRNHRFLLLSLLMTCCDLNDQLKGWKFCREVAVSIYTEFFQQGDIEKEMGLTPPDMMDREKAFIPGLQLEFQRDLCIPSFTVLSRIFREAKGYVDIMEEVARCWSRAVGWFKEHQVPNEASIKVMYDPRLEQYVLER